MAPRKVVGHCVRCQRERTASDQNFANFPGMCATCRWELKGKGINTMNNAGVSEQSAGIQQAHSAAQKALDEYQDLEADAQALAEDVNSKIAALLALGEPLREALQRRYAAYVRAVTSERTRAKLAGGESREDQIRIRPWRPIIRCPAGAINNVEINGEYSISVVPAELDDSVLESRSAAFEYLPTAGDRPLSRRKT